MPDSATLLLPSSVGYDYYTLCYLLAFGLNLVLLVWEGHRRGYPMRTWLVLLGCTTLSFILGTKLLALSGPEWWELLHTGQWPGSGARTVLGGALAGTLTLLALRRAFGFSWHVFDAFTLPMCAALAVQCVGCVLTGCCFGELTAGGWGLTYAPGTLPYLWQESRGLLTLGAAHSLPVHPTQLYSLGLCLAVGSVLLLTRRRAWPGGSRRLLHLGLLLAGRFLIEFWRDPAGEQVGAELRTHAGLALKQVQWALLVLAPLVLGGWAWLVRRARSIQLQPERIPAQNPVRNLLAVAGLLLITAWLGPQALTRPEVLVVKALLFTVLVLEGGALLLGAASAVRPARVALPLTLAAGVLVLTSQKLPPRAPTDSISQPYFSFTPGYAAGRFDQDVQYAASRGGCSGSSRPAARVGYYNAYRTYGGNFAYTRPSLKRPGRVSYGVGVWAGHQNINIQPLPLGGPFPSFSPRDGQRYSLLDINPYIERDRSRPGRLGYGLRLGLHLGEVAHSVPDTDPSKGLYTQHIMPDYSLWVGVRRAAFLHTDAGNGRLGVGNYTSRVALGSGLGSEWRRHVLAGVALTTETPGATLGFVSGSFPLGNSGLWLEPYGATNFGRVKQLSVRLQYRVKTRQ